MKKLSKLLVVLLALSMLLSSFVVVTNAGESAVAEIAEKGSYETLALAIANAEDGETVKLVRDVELTNDFAKAISIEGKAVKLNLNGYTLKVTNTVAPAIFDVGDEAEFTVRNGNIIVDGAKCFATNVSTLILRDVNIVADMQGSFVNVQDGSLDASNVTAKITSDADAFVFTDVFNVFLKASTILKYGFGNAVMAIDTAGDTNLNVTGTKIFAENNAVSLYTAEDVDFNKLKFAKSVIVAQNGTALNAADVNYAGTCADTVFCGEISALVSEWTDEPTGSAFVSVTEDKAAAILVHEIKATPYSNLDEAYDAAVDGDDIYLLAPVAGAVSVHKEIKVYAGINDVKFTSNDYKAEDEGCGVTAFAPAEEGEVAEFYFIVNPDYKPGDAPAALDVDGKLTAAVGTSVLYTGNRLPATVEKEGVTLYFAGWNAYAGEVDFGNVTTVTSEMAGLAIVLLPVYEADDEGSFTVLFADEYTEAVGTTYTSPELVSYTAAGVPERKRVGDDIYTIFGWELYEDGVRMSEDAYYVFGPYLFEAGHDYVLVPVYEKVGKGYTVIFTDADNEELYFFFNELPEYTGVKNLDVDDGEGNVSSPVSFTLSLEEGGEPVTDTEVGGVYYAKANYEVTSQYATVRLHVDGYEVSEQKLFVGEMTISELVSTLGYNTETRALIAKVLAVKDGAETVKVNEITEEMAGKVYDVDVYYAARGYSFRAIRPDGSVRGYYGGFANLASAFGELADGSTVVLLDNFAFEETVAIDGKTVVLDLNGYKLSNIADPAFALESGAELVLTSSKAGGIYDSKKPLASVGVGCELMIGNYAFDAKSGEVVTVAAYAENVSVKAGVIATTSEFSFITVSSATLTQAYKGNALFCLGGASMMFEGVTAEIKKALVSFAGELDISEVDLAKCTLTGTGTVATLDSSADVFAILALAGTSVSEGITVGGAENGSSKLCTYLLEGNSFTSYDKTNVYFDDDVLLATTDTGYTTRKLGFALRQSMSLGEDIAEKILVPKAEELAGIVLDGETVDLETLEEEDDCYVFNFTKIALEDLVKEHVFAFTMTTGETLTVKVAPLSYFESLIETEGYEEEKQLVRDFLEYVRAAYNYFELNASPISALITKYSAYKVTKVALPEVADVGELSRGILSASLILDAEPAFIFTVRDYFWGTMTITCGEVEKTYEFKKNGTCEGKPYAEFVFEDRTDLEQDLTITMDGILFRYGTEINVSGTYNIANYIDGLTTEEYTPDYAIALYRYIVSAENYVATLAD